MKAKNKELTHISYSVQDKDAVDKRMLNNYILCIRYCSDTTSHSLNIFCSIQATIVIPFNPPYAKCYTSLTSVVHLNSKFILCISNFKQMI